MAEQPRILIYGANGYTGKLVAESLAARGLSFLFAGRSRDKLAQALAVVRERHGGAVNAEIVEVPGTVEGLLPVLRDVDIVINVAGPFMQIAWPVVEAALQAGCHYLDTTGEQDWTREVAARHGDDFAARELLLAPATSYMWSAGILAAEVVLETPGIDSLDICYQIDNGLPSVASTKSFLRMICNDETQYYLAGNEYRPWPNDVFHKIGVPYRSASLHAHPWGGACEPVWYKDDPRVRNCSVLTAIGEHMVDGLKQALAAFNEAAPGLDRGQREQWTNRYGEGMSVGEPPKDSVDVQRSVIVVHGQGRQITRTWAMSLAAPYTWTGELCAEAAQRILDGRLMATGFQPATKAFGHRGLIDRFHQLGFCSAAPAG